MKDLKYLIVGTGGTGGCIGAYLAKAGFDVDFIARGKHLAEIRKNGLTVKSSELGEFNIKANACTMEEYTGKADVIFVCVKYYSLEEAIELTRKASKENTVVIPILNVFGTGSTMQERLPQLTVTDGCIYIYSFVEKSGVIAKPSDIFKVYFGLREGQSRDAMPILIKVAEDMKKSGMDAFLSDNIKKDTFRKFTYISPVASAGLYCNAVAGDFVREGETRDVLVSLMTELLSLGKAMGIEYQEDMVKVNMDIIAGLDPKADTSMQRDVASGHQSEFDGLVTGVIKLGEKYGVPMPTYKMLADKIIL